MSKRLQVLMEETEYQEIRALAQAQHLSVAEWVRQALKQARRNEPEGDIGRKLEVIRAAVRHEYPTADIDQMVAEIERGYGD